MRNTGLEEAQTGIKIARRNINNIRYADVGNLISGSSAFSKTSLNIRKFTVHALLKPAFMVHVLLKPRLENFEHYFTSV